MVQLALIYALIIFLRSSGVGCFSDKTLIVERIMEVVKKFVAQNINLREIYSKILYMYVLKVFANFDLHLILCWTFCSILHLKVINT
jgi:hypothetical protein